MNKFLVVLLSALFALLLIFISSINFESLNAKKEASLGYTDTILNVYFDLKTRELSEFYAIYKEQEAECRESSQLTPRPDALKCTIAGKVADPCYVNDLDNPTKVACVLTPWDKGITLAHIKGDVPKLVNGADFLDRPPYAIEFEDGNRCILNNKKYYQTFAGMESTSICFDEDISFIKSKTYGDIDKSHLMYRTYFDSGEAYISKRKIKYIYY